MPLTYCTRADLESLWSPTAVLRAVDDDHDGALADEEVGHITRAIERAANKMNAALEMRYALVQLVANSWCRDCNALLAVYLLATRRGHPAPEHLRDQYEGFLRDLAEIRDGRLKVPEANDGCESIPTVTNFTTDLRRPRAKARRVRETSTGSPPPPGRASFPDD